MRYFKLHEQETAANCNCTILYVNNCNCNSFQSLSEYQKLTKIWYKRAFEIFRTKLENGSPAPSQRPAPTTIASRNAVAPVRHRLVRWEHKRPQGSAGH